MGELYNEEGSAAWDKINETINAGAKTAEEQKCSGVMASVAILF